MEEVFLKDRYHCVWYISCPKTQTEISAMCKVLSVYLPQRYRQEAARGELALAFMNVYMHERITYRYTFKNISVTLNMQIIVD